MKNQFITLIIFSILFIAGCKDDDNSSRGNFENGIFILNEGQFQVGNGSITYYDDNADTTALEIFSSVNGRPLGDIVQSIAFDDTQGYIVVNNSNKVEVVDANTFEEIATVTGLELPRDILIINDNKAYISQWGTDGVSGSIQIMDLNTNSISGSIDITGGGPDKLKMVNGSVYVGYSGGFGVDQLITIIDPNTDTVIEDIDIDNGFNTDDMVLDSEGNLWALSLGYYDWMNAVTIPSVITAFNPTDHSVVKEFELSTTAGDLQINADGDQLFFILGGEIVSMDTSNDVLELTTIANDAYFYGLGYDADKKRLYAGDGGDFVSSGSVLMYDESGNALGTIPAGVGPGAIFTGK